MGSATSSQQQLAAKPSAPAAPQMSEQDKAVMQLKISRDKLQKYRKKAEKEREILERTAKEQLKLGKKDKALVVLRTKKLKEQRLKQLEAQLDNVAKLLSSIEEASTTKLVMASLEAGNLELKKLNEEMPIERIEEIMQDSEEAISHQEEIMALLGQSLTAEDVSDVDDELMEMAAEVSGVDVNKLPEAPTTHVDVETKEPAKKATNRVLEAA